MSVLTFPHLGLFKAPAQSFHADLIDLGLDEASLFLNETVDAGSSASYPGTGTTWTDLDGVGTWTLDAAGMFQGTAGNLSQSEYMLTDGAQDIVRAVQPSWANNIHKASAKFTMLIWYYTAGTENQGIAGTLGVGTIGFNWSIGEATAGHQRLLVANTATVLSVEADAAIASAGWHLAGISLDETVGAGGGFFYLDGVYDQVGASDTFDSTYTSPSAAAATNSIQLFATGGGQNIASSGTRIAGFMEWGSALTKAQIDTVWVKQRGRFGL